MAARGQSFFAIAQKVYKNACRYTPLHPALFASLSEGLGSMRFELETGSSLKPAGKPLIGNIANKATRVLEKHRFRRYCLTLAAMPRSGPDGSRRVCCLSELHKLPSTNPCCRDHRILTSNVVLHHFQGHVQAGPSRRKDRYVA